MRQEICGLVLGACVLGVLACPDRPEPRMQADARGVTVVTFDRPPVNAVSFDVYPDLRDLCEIIESTDQTRVVVLTSPPNVLHGEIVIRPRVI